MAEVSGQPIVNKSDSIAASYLKPQDYFMNPPAGGSSVFTVPNLSLNDQGSIPTSGGLTASGLCNVNIASAFTASGRTITAAGSGIFAPLGFYAIKVSGMTCVVPFFAA